MCLKTEHHRFLDVTNFLAPGFSYEMFLKAYECPQTRGFFPHGEQFHTVSGSMRGLKQYLFPLNKISLKR